MQVKNVPEIRFKGFEDEWKENSFSNITYFSGIKNKDNVSYESYSISNENGFVKQEEQFENGGTMRGANKRLYYIVSPHSFAYNPARINIGSIGYQNLEKNVIVSSLYEIFKTTENIDDIFLWYWFKSENFKKLILRLQEGGVRLYFFYNKLCIGKISIPDKNEQEKIGLINAKIDLYLSILSNRINLIKKFKQLMLSKMFPREGSDVPEIRFEGFSDKWEKNNFSDTFYFLQNIPLSRSDLTEKKKDYFTIHYGDILINYNEILDVRCDTVFSIKSNIDIEKYKQSYIKNGDVIFADAAEDETVGKCIEADGISDEKIISGLHTIPCRSKIQFYGKYLGYYLNSPVFHSQLFSKMQGIKVLSISKKTLCDTYIIYPLDTNEQKKIVSFFANITSEINNLSNMYNFVLKLKNTLLSKMFI